MKIWIAFKASSDEDQFDLAMTNMEVVGWANELAKKKAGQSPRATRPSNLNNAHSLDLVLLLKNCYQAVISASFGRL
eukprot:scaffold23035_cov73-Cyclotella_meneghiniana.AAC.3